MMFTYMVCLPTHLCSLRLAVSYLLSIISYPPPTLVSSFLYHAESINQAATYQLARGEPCTLSATLPLFLQQDQQGRPPTLPSVSVISRYILVIVLSLSVLCCFFFFIFDLNVYTYIYTFLQDTALCKLMARMMNGWESTKY